MKTRTKILAVLSLPVGAVGYIVSAWILQQLPIPDAIEGAVLLFVPLLVGGLCMAPLLIPFFDQLAKRDLAELQARRDAEASAGKPGDDPRP